MRPSSKLAPKDSGAQRELLLAGNLSGVPNVVPVLGVGDAGDSWAILMARAAQSLRDLLGSVGGWPLDQDLALPILLDVAHALVSLEKNGVVHRDLKPDNILLLDGHWCLTDFGISRYAEATTAVDTRKYSMTKPYTAPEQWREERATWAADVYAFGITAYELLTGGWPFNGPDFRSQHLHEGPPSLSATIGNPLRSIIDECLIKAAQARPTPERLLARLQAQTAAEAPSGGAAVLIAAPMQRSSV
jgi:serine/threonine protein kinase